MQIIKAPRGTHDILPADIYKWHKVEEIMRDLCRKFAYREIRTPMFEHTELFTHGVGETTDVVQKEMYTFSDKGDRSITLKPEGTSPVVRSFIEHSLYAGPQPSKLYYITPCFRYEKPQAGRLRAFHQFGVEVFGAIEPAIDAEVISLALSVFNTLGIGGISLNINSIGCPECRRKYNEILREFFHPHLDSLCETCRTRYEKNPLRILDCKNAGCKEIYYKAPVLLDNICDDCSAHFESLKKYLDAMGIEYNIDGTIVRGLDYYTKTVFEIVSSNIGAKGTVCGGGRYNGLVESLGGPEIAGVGFGLGMERLMLLIDSLNISLENNETPDIFIANIGENADFYAQKLCADLRNDGISAERDYLKRSVKAQMKYADKINAKFTMVLGDNEINKQTVNIKNMATGEQEKVKLSEIADFLSQRR